ncbi:MAG: glucose-1-phosphate adenylyltransferase [Clostridia bacterium]|nr:glucose-1-phosphate adenylyltransferase [Clostridia bacterium]
MLQKKECVAMLLAGGQGSRLYNLTEKNAKPAVPFGGKYRIIDFTLSNCVNSGIDTVGVLTQYQPYVLNEYIGSGQPWDLDKTYGGVKILPPYQRANGAYWYKGTANAIYQNLGFVERYDPDYVLILSGDHIYKMDYYEMLEYHRRKGADCTIAVIDVPLNEASRFGIMNTNEDGSIYEFEEKPAHPKSTKASMGIYIFGTKILEKYLEEDDKDPASSNDFGKNVIPKMLKEGAKMYAYPFKGYWKDVGTVQSLWEANMDLIGDRPALDLRTSERRIFSRNSTRPPHYAGPDAKIVNSLVTEGCEIYGTVVNSVLFGGVKVAEGAVVRDSVIFEETEIGEGTTVDYAILDCRISTGKNSKIGDPIGSGCGITLLGADMKIPDGVQIAGGTMTSRLEKEEK